MAQPVAALAVGCESNSDSESEIGRRTEDKACPAQSTACGSLLPILHLLVIHHLVVHHLLFLRDADAAAQHLPSEARPVRLARARQQHKPTFLLLQLHLPFDITSLLCRILHRAL